VRAQDGPKNETTQEYSKLGLETVEATSECATDDRDGQVSNPKRDATDGSTGEISGATEVEMGCGEGSLVVLQVNCRSICNKVLNSGT